MNGHLQQSTPLQDVWTFFLKVPLSIIMYIHATNSVHASTNGSPTQLYLRSILHDSGIQSMHIRDKEWCGEHYMHCSGRGLHLDLVIK